MAEQARQTYSYAVAEHIFGTFLGENDFLTPDERRNSRVQPGRNDDPLRTSEIIAYRNVGGVAMAGQILRQTADGEGYEVITKPKYRGKDHVRIIRKYGRDPIEKIVGSLFACELIRIVNDRA